MGSRSKTNLAYIAGFLDGDGSLMIQIKKRSDSKSGKRFMLTICFYQDSRHEKPLFWIREILGIGYVSRRNDGMTELRINGYRQVGGILKELMPFLKFKKVQAQALVEAADLLSKHPSLDQKILTELVDKIIVVQSQNYVTRKKRSKEELLRVLGLTP